MQTSDVSLRTAGQLMRLYLNSKVPPHIWGPPGVGKSALVKEFAKEKNLKLIDLRASSMTPSDLGVPDRVTTDKGNRIEFLIPTDFPLEQDELPINPETGEAYNGWLLFLDEFMSAPEEVQAAFFKVILDRQIGQGTLHPRVYVVAASNREEHGGIVNQMSTPMKSRFAHISVRSELKTWLEGYAYANVLPEIISFVSSAPKHLNNLELEGSDTFTCERTWDMLSRVMTKAMGTDRSVNDLASDRTFAVAAEGIIGPAVAAEFTAYLRYFSQIPTAEEVIADPDNTAIPNSTDKRFAMLSVVAGAYSSDLIAKTAVSDNRALLTFLKRFPLDMQVIGIKFILANVPSKRLIDHTELVKWTKENPTIWG